MFIKIHEENIVYYKKNIDVGMYSLKLMKKILYTTKYVDVYIIISVLTDLYSKFYKHMK